MTTYKITTDFETFEVDVSGSDIIGVRPHLKTLIGMRFSLFRDQARRYGWNIIPVLEEEPHPRWLEYRGELYEFHWHEGKLVRISHHQDGVPNDILFEQLPFQLQHLL